MLAHLPTARQFMVRFSAPRATAMRLTKRCSEVQKCALREELHQQKPQKTIKKQHTKIFKLSTWMISSSLVMYSPVCSYSSHSQLGPSAVGLLGASSSRQYSYTIIHNIDTYSVVWLTRVRRGSVSRGSTCSKAGPSPNLSSAPHTAKIQYRKFETNIPRKGTGQPQP
jgi:hypothetical protein